MNTHDFEKTKRESLINLKVSLDAADLTLAWAERRLDISKGYLSNMMRAGDVPSLELALRINELVVEIKKLALVS